MDTPYKILVENVSEVVVLLSLDGRFEYVSPQVQEVFGYGVDEIEGRNLMEFLHPDDFSLARTRLVEVSETLLASTYEYRVRHKRGHYVPVRGRSKVIDLDGEPKLVSAFSDCTEAVHAEKLLEIQRDLGLSLCTVDTRDAAFSLVFDSLKNIENVDCGGLYIVQTDGSLTGAGVFGVSEVFAARSKYYGPDTANARFVAAGKPLYFNYSESDLIIDEPTQSEGIRALAVIPISYGGSVIACLNLASRSVDEFSPWARMAMEGIASTVGGVITRFRAEDVITDQQLRYRLLFSEMPVGLSITTETGEVIDINPALEMCTGYSCEELRELGIGVVYADSDDRRRLMEFLDRDGSVGGFEFRGRHKSGEEIDLSITVCKASVGSGSILLSFVEDVTDKKRDLAIRERLREEQFDVEKMESLGILAGGIAHDFNNLLNAVIGFLSMADTRIEPGSPVKGYTSEAQRAAEKAAGLTKQLMLLSRGGPIVQETSSLHDLVTEIADLSLRGTSVRISYDFQDGLWPVDVDRSQFSRVVQNLVINARQAMVRGGTVEIVARNRELEEANLTVAAGRWVELRISDHGSGIAQDDLSRVFDPYFTTKAKGTGLGLAATYSIVKKHGGHIRVESEPERGATFEILIPASECLIEEISMDLPRSIRPPTRILVLDDESTNLLLFKLAFREQAGLFVEGADTGEAAIALFEEAARARDPFNLVILDLTLKGEEGAVEILKRLKATSPGVSSIVCSGYGFEEYASHGFDAYLQKPFTHAQLIEVVDRVLLAR